ncbi:Lateral organ boundaries LOB [Arabidopsis suecica]|uniref:Lateral organ boundaries LOB n=1 Tax=Arabidopsis suecica TaxID=45249 RepID=A0A8T1Z8R6_ARASU|nr:Lateral organ boundaries LOB [Arabidopsis suecica]
MMMMPNKLVFFFILTSVIILMTSQGSSGVNNGSKTEACVACKYQRRRCTSDCIFRLHFPVGRNQDFENVHRLFGVRRVVKHLEELEPEVRGDAMKSIIDHSNMRYRFPVGGCYEVMINLQNRIAFVTAELLRSRSLLTAVVAASNPSAAFFNPTAANFFYPAANNFFNPSAAANFFYPAANNFFNPSAAANFFHPTASVESELINPSRYLNANNDDFTRVPANDGTIDFLGRVGYCGNLAHEECVTETTPLEGAPNNNAQQFLPNTNNLGSNPRNANANEELEQEQLGGAPRNNDIPRELYEFLTDEERSFSEAQDSGDKCAYQSMTKKDDFPFP